MPLHQKPSPPNVNDVSMTELIAEPFVCQGLAIEEWWWYTGWRVHGPQGYATIIMHNNFAVQLDACNGHLKLYAAALRVQGGSRVGAWVGGWVNEETGA